MTKRRPPLSRLAALAAVLLLALSLAACTRERAAPEGADATPGAESATAPAGAPTDAQATEPAGTADATTPAEPGGEPVVTVAAGTAEADGTPTPGEGETTTGEHEVQSGETLMSIALLYDTDVETLRRLNFLPDDVIQVGQRLIVPITPPTPTPTPAPFIYVVQSGDTLFSLVRRFGVAAEDLVNANNITDPNTLVPGTELVIPGYAPEGAAPVAEGTAEGGTDGGPAGTPATGGDDLVQHVVQPGETFSEIAALYGVEEEELAVANGIANRNQLRSGQTLTIPGLTRAQLREAQTVTHTVAQGETLSEIAQQYGVDADVIIEENGLANPNDIRVGQELRIPPP
jgi:LysM repeat protein